jgi:hypothetical protein
MLRIVMALCIKNPYGHTHFLQINQPKAPKFSRLNTIKPKKKKKPPQDYSKNHPYGHTHFLQINQPKAPKFSRLNTIKPKKKKKTPQDYSKTHTHSLHTERIPTRRRLGGRGSQPERIPTRGKRVR